MYKIYIKPNNYYNFTKIASFALLPKSETIANVINDYLSYFLSEDTIIIKIVEREKNEYFLKYNTNTNEFINL